MVHRPRVLMTVMFVLTAACIAGISRVSFDSSLRSLTVPDDPARLFHEGVQATFGDEEVGVIAVVADDVYTPEVLEALRRLTDAVARIDGVVRALSLSSASDPAADVLTPPPLLAKGPIGVAQAARLRERVELNKIYVPHLVSSDGRAAAINVFFRRDRSATDDERVDDAIAALVSGYDGPGKVYYAGSSHIRVRAVRLMRADLLRFLPLSLLCMMAVLWLSFASVRAVVLPLGAIALGVAALLGLMGWLGEPITLTTLVLPSLLLVIGGSYSVHVTAAVLEEQAAGVSGAAGVEAVLRRIGLPVTISALTTAVGFGSLAFHRIPAISRLGVFAVAGIVVMAVGCLCGLTVAYFVAPERTRPRRDSSRDAAGLIDRIAESAAGFGVAHRYLVFFISAAIVAVAAVGASRIAIDTDLLSAFRPDSDVRIAHQAIADNLAGPNPISVVVTGPEPGYFRSIAPLRRVKDFQDFITELDGVDASISLVDYLEELDLGLQASAGDLIVTDQGELVEKPPPPSFWDAPTAQLPEIFDIVALSPQTFSGLVDDEFQRLRVTVRTSVSGSLETARVVSEITTYAAVMFPLGVKVKPTGHLVVVGSVADRVLSGQIESLALALAVILGVLALLFLSLRVGVAAMIPNLVPIFVFFGVMGWCGVELNLATSIIAAVSLGISVDDTIHYMARLNSIVKTAPTQSEALRMTMRAVGRPVIATSLTLTAGFLVMVLSKFVIISAFGWLSAMTMMVALATNIVLLPAILASVPVISVWDLVAFRLGPRPNQTIPLFQGLGRLALRLVVLMGTLRSFTSEQCIMRRGEPGREMYLVLTGRADVLTADGRGVLASLERGDVVGEMALLRSRKRTADVIARGDVDVLVIDEEFLRRLRNRYPRVASRFFVNIARILSDRLEQANRRLGLVD